RFRLTEEQVKAFAERLLLVLGFCQCQQEGVAQDIAIGKADAFDRAHRVDAFGRRDPDARSPRRAKEPVQVLPHRRPQPNTFWREAFATKVVTCGSATSISASSF